MEQKKNIEQLGILKAFASCPRSHLLSIHIIMSQRTTDMITFVFPILNTCQQYCQDKK